MAREDLIERQSARKGVDFSADNRGKRLREMGTFRFL